MNEVSWFWVWFIQPIASALGTLALYLVLFALFLLFYVALNSKRWRKQRRCKHDGEFSESMSCRATCLKCGADLGFIGTARKKYPKART